MERSSLSPPVSSVFAIFLRHTYQLNQSAWYISGCSPSHYFHPFATVIGRGSISRYMNDSHFALLGWVMGAPFEQGKDLCVGNSVVLTTILGDKET